MNANSEDFSKASFKEFKALSKVLSKVPRATLEPQDREDRADRKARQELKEHQDRKDSKESQDQILR